MIELTYQEPQMFAHGALMLSLLVLVALVAGIVCVVRAIAVRNRGSNLGPVFAGIGIAVVALIGLAAVFFMNVSDSQRLDRRYHAQQEKARAEIALDRHIDSRAAHDGSSSIPFESETPYDSRAAYDGSSPIPPESETPYYSEWTPVQSHARGYTDSGEHSRGVIAIIPVMFLVLLILGLPLALLANSSTRPFGKALLGLEAVVAIFGLPAFWFMMQGGDEPELTSRRFATGVASKSIAGDSDFSPSEPTTVDSTEPTEGSISPEPDTEQQSQSGSSEEDPPRPEWVDAAPTRVGPVYEVVITSDPFTSSFECERDLDQKLADAVASYVSNLLGPEAARRVELAPVEARQQIVADQWMESLDTSVGPMKRMHAQLQFDQDVQELFRKRWQEAVLTERLLAVGGGFVGLLLILGIAFGYLHLDTQTKGYYSGRLLLAAALAILVVIGALGVWVIP